jgi:hypothetical protein
MFVDIGRVEYFSVGIIAAAAAAAAILIPLIFWGGDEDGVGVGEDFGVEGVGDGGGGGGGGGGRKGRRRGIHLLLACSLSM